MNLKSKIINQKASIGIIGLGYVGLPLLIRFSEEGFQTIGFDVDVIKVNKLNEGQSYINHISAEIIKTTIDININKIIIFVD